MKGLLGIALGAWVLLTGWQAFELSRMAAATKALQSEVGELRGTLTEMDERLEAVETDLDDLVAELEGSTEAAAMASPRRSGFPARQVAAKLPGR